MAAPEQQPEAGDQVIPGAPALLILSWNPTLTVPLDKVMQLIAACKLMARLGNQQQRQQLADIALEDLPEWLEGNP